MRGKRVLFRATMESQSPSRDPVLWVTCYLHGQFLQCSDKTREKCQPAQMQGPGRCKQKVGEITRRLWERRLLWNTLAFETKQKGSWTSWHLVGVVGVSELAMLEFRFWLCCSDELCYLGQVTKPPWASLLPSVKIGIILCIPLFV